MNASGEIYMDKIEIYREKLRATIAEYGEGSRSRANVLANYVRRTAPVFRAMCNKAPVPPPLCVQIEITNDCTTGCRMCRRWEWTREEEYDRSREVTVEEFCKLFKELGTLGVGTVLFTGGEPTAHPEFKKLVQDAADSGLRVALLSNGVGLTADVSDCIARYVDWIRISLDDVPAITTKPVRQLLRTFKAQAGSGRRVADEVTTSLSNLLMATRANSESRVRVSLGFTIQRTNVYHVPRMIDWVSNDPVARALDLQLELKLVHGSGPFLLRKEDLQWLRQNVLESEIFESNQFANIAFLRRSVLSLGLTNLVLGQPTAGLYRSRHCGCFVPYLFSLIDAFGDVHVCCHWYDDNGPFASKLRANSVIGNIRGATFESLWQSSRYRDVRKQLEHVDPDVVPCASCSRHWLSNLALSAIYRDVFAPLVDECDGGIVDEAYELLLNEYPDDTPIWL